MKVELSLHNFSLVSHAWIGQTLSTRNENCRILQRWITIQADEGLSAWRREVAPSMPMSQSQQELQTQQTRNKKMPVARRISHTTQLSSKIYVKLERQIASSTLSTRIKQCDFLQFTRLNNCALYLLILGMEIYLHELFSSWLQFLEFALSIGNWLTSSSHALPILAILAAVLDLFAFQLPTPHQATAVRTLKNLHYYVKIPQNHQETTQCSAVILPHQPKLDV